MKDKLVINLSKRDNFITLDETTATIDFLENSILYVKRAKEVHIIAENINKTLRNHITQYKISCPDLEIITLKYFDKVFAGYEQIENFFATVTTTRATNNCESKARWDAEWIRTRFNIDKEIAEHIDDYLNTELLSAYDITIGTSMTLVEKKNTYKPTDLERKEWNINDSDFAFSHDDKLVYRYIPTYEDKLQAYATLMYYIQNGLDSHEYNETKTGSISRKCLADTLTICGHADRIPPVDEFDSFQRDYNFQFLLYSDNRDN